jgi:hypothetical protein
MQLALDVSGTSNGALGSANGTLTGTFNRSESATNDTSPPV